MATQPLVATKITVTRELIEKAGSCNETWEELSVAIQNHLQMSIGQRPVTKGVTPWPQA